MLPEELRGPAVPAEDPTPVGALSQELSRHARILHMLKSRMFAVSGYGLDHGALSVLFQVVKSGPIRQGELAECAMLDPSTVSRHVSLLVRLGHVERRADPGDGRAVRLIATPRGLEVHDQVMGRRDAMIRDVLAGWPDEDVRDLTGRLRRLNDDFEAFRPQLRLPGVPPFSAISTAPRDQSAQHSTDRPIEQPSHQSAEADYEER